MKAAAEQIRSLIAEGKLKIRCADMGEGDDSTFLVHNLQEENGTFVLSSNDFLCHPIEPMAGSTVPGATMPLG